MAIGVFFCYVLSTGPGCFISVVERLSGRKAVMAGKPGVLIKDFISKRHPLNPERTLMIGDM
jgi:ribonucleotide monophosphatase NagD (HAD superfamily)